jgi:hypothetical protein
MNRIYWIVVLTGWTGYTGLTGWFSDRIYRMNVIYFWVRGAGKLLYSSRTSRPILSILLLLFILSYPDHSVTPVHPILS